MIASHQLSVEINLDEFLKAVGHRPIDEDAASKLVCEVSAELHELLLKGKTSRKAREQLDRRIQHVPDTYKYHAASPWTNVMMEDWLLFGEVIDVERPLIRRQRWNGSADRFLGMWVHPRLEQIGWECLRSGVRFVFETMLTDEERQSVAGLEIWDWLAVNDPIPVDHSGNPSVAWVKEGF